MKLLSDVIFFCMATASDPGMCLLALQVIEQKISFLYEPSLFDKSILLEAVYQIPFL